MPYVAIRYERAKLYEEVWAEPVVKVAKQYGISDVALRKICKKLAVPLPPLGYWAKLAAGKKLPTPPLPKHAGPAAIIRQRFVSNEPVEPDPEHLVARRTFEARPENRIVVSETLDMPHSLVVATERALRRPRRANHGAPARPERLALDVSVSEASLPRALRIMDALAKALEARGIPLGIESEGKRRSRVIVQGQELALRLVETNLRTERKPTDDERRDMKKYGYVYLPNRYSYQPTGLLKLGIISEYYNELKQPVSDGKHQRVERCLNDFVVKLEAEAVRRKREAERREREHRLWEERARLQREREERQRKELERLQALEAEAREWKRAEDIRAYVHALETKTVRDQGAIDPNGELGLWIAWARRNADSIDPLVESEGTVLDDEHDHDDDDHGHDDDGDDDDGDTDDNDK
jgi:hypothetical protein